MSIYSRDNINYGSMLQNAVANRISAAEKRANAIKAQGEIWSGLVKDLGSMGARTYDAYQAEKESPEYRLKQLEEELRQAEIEQKYNEQVAQRRAVNDYIAEQRARASLPTQGEIYSRDMDGYNPQPDMTGYSDYLRTMNRDRRLY